MSPPNLATLRSSNASIVSALKGTPVAVFVGGTSGIGQGLAESFAAWRNGNADIILVGRNEKAASAIIKKFPKLTTSDASSPSSTPPSYSFVQCDATLMKNVKAASAEILAKHPKINYLILSPGFFSTSGRDETSEGIDKKLAVHYYARFKFIQELLPALRKAKEDGEEAKVLTVLGAGRGSKIDVEDLGLKKHFSPTAAAGAAPTYNDLAMEAFAERDPNITFVHSFPGAVQSGIVEASPSGWLTFARPAFKLYFKLFGISAEECAQRQWAGLLATPSTGGAYRIGDKGEDLGKANYFGDEEQRKKLWEHSIQGTSV